MHLQQSCQLSRVLDMQLLRIGHVAPLDAMRHSPLTEPRFTMRQAFHT